MDIYLTPSGGSRIQFPMLPEAITMGADAKFMTYSIISLGDVKLPRCLLYTSDAADEL